MGSWDQDFKASFVRDFFDKGGVIYLKELISGHTYYLNDPIGNQSVETSDYTLYSDKTMAAIYDIAVFGSPLDGFGEHEGNPVQPHSYQYKNDMINIVSGDLEAITKERERVYSMVRDFDEDAIFADDGKKFTSRFLHSYLDSVRNLPDDESRYGYIDTLVDDPYTMTTQLHLDDRSSTNIFAEFKSSRIAYETYSDALTERMSIFVPLSYLYDLKNLDDYFSTGLDSRLINNLVADGDSKLELMRTVSGDKDYVRDSDNPSFGIVEDSDAGESTKGESSRLFIGSIDPGQIEQAKYSLKVGAPFDLGVKGMADIYVFESEVMDDKLHPGKKMLCLDSSRDYTFDVTVDADGKTALSEAIVKDLGPRANPELVRVRASLPAEELKQHVEAGRANQRSYSREQMESKAMANVKDNNQVQIEDELI